MGRVNYSISLLVSLLMCVPAVADIYKSVDGKGNVSYSDEPVKDEKPMELPILNVIPPPPEPPAGPVSEITNAYQAFYVSTPVDGTTVPRGQNTLMVEISLAPTLRSDHLMMLSLNGEETGKPQKDRRFEVQLHDPGTQRLTASIVNNSGNIIQTTPPVTFHNISPGPLTTTILRGEALKEGNTQEANRYAPKAPQAPQAPQAPRLTPASSPPAAP